LSYARTLAAVRKLSNAFGFGNQFVSHVGPAGAL